MLLNESKLSAKNYDIVRLGVIPFFPGLWGLVNNAGVWYFSELEMTSDSLLRKVMETNVLGAISLTRALLPQIRQAKGRVINVSSLLGKVHYCRKKIVFAWSLLIKA